MRLFPCLVGLCPILCSSHGRYGGGLCHCDSGWKGVECEIPESECEIGNCHGNGDCVNGNCVCREGWTGPACQNRKFVLIPIHSSAVTGSYSLSFREKFHEWNPTSTRLGIHDFRKSNLPFPTARFTLPKFEHDLIRSKAHLCYIHSWNDPYSIFSSSFFCPT